MLKKTNTSSRPSPRPETDKRNDAGGAPAPNYTIPCPPKPKK